MIVGLILMAFTLLILVATSFLIAMLFFGSASMTSPLGGSFDVTTSWQRLGIVAAYIGLMLLIPAGIAFLMSTLTDVPLGAVGVAVVIVIVLNIVDALDALGDLRRFLPTHYNDAWSAALAQEIAWDDMAIGGSLAVVTFAALVAVAWLRFDRKDITS